MGRTTAAPTAHAYTIAGLARDGKYSALGEQRQAFCHQASCPVMLVAVANATAMLSGPRVSMHGRPSARMERLRRDDLCLRRAGRRLLTFLRAP
jgi:hypothetical protein